MQGNTFDYASYWSDPDTWKGEFAPQDGDSLHIPAGQMLIVDIDVSPMLWAVIVEGSLVFIPDKDENHRRTFDANYIFIKGGVFEVGTSDHRYTSKLTITMHGVRESLQIPVYGNKGIFVRNARFDMHGAMRNVTWTELDTTIEIGGQQISLVEHVDWQIGERIVIASTDFSLEHTEEFIIDSIDNSKSPGSVITLKTPAQHKHYAGVTPFTASNGVNPDMSKTLTMRAEVALMDRNVIFKGADDDSVENQYGAHIMLHSPGDESLTGKISYIELAQVGQAFQLGRYPIHFHMIGTVHGSYIKGNSIHHTYNRAVTIHGVQYLHIENNLAYQTMGHTFFIEDAAETYNYVVRNLAMKTMRSWALLNSDQTPASFWITHPSNYFIDNHAAGSAHYGFWFDLKETPTGPSYDPDVCPQHEHLGEFTGNVAHSNGRYGLRIFTKYIPKETPCAERWGGDFVNMYKLMRFKNFLAYKSNRTGLIAEEIGAVRFHNITVADNLFAGMEFGQVASGPWINDDEEYHVQDALVVGFSENAEHELQTNVNGLLHDIGDNANEFYHGTRGIKGARSEKFRVKDTLFANYNHDKADFGPIGTCSHCEGPETDSSGRTYFFKNLYFFNSTRRVMFDVPYKEILYDQDGTLGNSTHRWITHYYSHLDVPECEKIFDIYGGTLCHKDISIRRIVIWAISPKDLDGSPLKIMNLQNIDKNRRMLSDNCGLDNATTATWANIDNTDDEALMYQQQLLDFFHWRMTNKTEYDLYNSKFEKKGNESDGQKAAAALKNMEDAQKQIDKLEPIVEQYKSKYDELWKTDTHFCNPKKFQGIGWRKNKNPAKHW